MLQVSIRCAGKFHGWVGGFHRAGNMVTSAMWQGCRYATDERMNRQTDERRCCIKPLAAGA